MAKTEKERIEQLYARTLLSVEKIKDRVAEIENRMANPENTANDIHKLAAALNNVTKSQQNEINVLKSLSIVLESMEEE